MGIWLLVLTCFLPFGLSDQGLLLNGERVAGKLSLNANGQLQFQTDSAALRLDQLAQVRFPAASLPPFRIAMPHRVSLAGGQFLTGEFLGLDDQELHFRTAWADKLSIPRNAILSLLHAQGYVTFFQDDFENGLQAWKVSGAALSDQEHTSGKSSLKLNAPGQAVEYTLRESLTAGQLGVNFFEPGPTPGVHWLVQADFEGAKDAPNAQVLVAGDGKGYRVGASGIAGDLGDLRREPGWHRLTLEFKPRMLTVAVDHLVLGTSDRLPAYGALRKVHLVCGTLPDAKPAAGAVYFDDFSVARGVPAMRRPAGDGGQDEVWLLSGDQLFGSVPQADRRAIELRSKPGMRKLPWGQVREIVFRQPKAPPAPAGGARIRVWLRSGLGPEPDELVGKVLGLDGQLLLLQHETLGKLTIDRPRLHRLREETD